MPTIAHLEIPVDDLERAKKFYTELFGWKITPAPGQPDSPEYWLITTTDGKGEPGVGGGMIQRQHPQHPITNYIDVPSIEQSAAKVQEIGGNVVVPKTAVPGFGYFAVCLDTENNCFALWQTDSDAR